MKKDETEASCSSARVVGTVSFLTQKWNEKADRFVEQQKLNPFSGRYCDSNRKRWVKGTEEYARPVGKTAERAQRARRHIKKEIETLCYIISRIGRKNDNGKIYVTFRELFESYTKISNTVVGLLIRARRHRLVDFVGEMLWQRRDDDVIITLCNT